MEITRVIMTDSGVELCKNVSAKSPTLFLFSVAEIKNKKPVNKMCYRSLFKALLDYNTRVTKAKGQTLTEVELKDASGFQMSALLHEDKRKKELKEFYGDKI